mgnify:FL=1
MYLPVGNLARALMGVFKNQKLVAKYTGVPIKFIQGIWHVYLALTSNRLSVCPDKLMSKYLELKRIWQRVIPWYPFTPSVHRIRHIPLMIKLLHEKAPTLRIGMMSEEAGESVNKFLKASVTSVVEFEWIVIRFLPIISCGAKIVHSKYYKLLKV